MPSILKGDQPPVQLCAANSHTDHPVTRELEPLQRLHQLWERSPHNPFEGGCDVL